MFRKVFLALFAVLFLAVGVSAATVDVVNANAYGTDALSLSYTLVQTNAATAQNCTLYENIDGSWGVSSLASVDSSLTNGTNSFSVTPDFSSYSRGDTALFNVLCADNASTSAQDATNGTITYYVYVNQYSTSDLNEQVVDIMGTSINASLSWIDLLVLLAILGVGLSLVMGVLYKGGRIIGLG